ncbi:cytochrome b5 reductase 4 [Drosophila sulfurigaster albostrigata]|uniref:cytochrome b5 reductase 4 n=1 Tax=Drosophila sulfurigaster albostrigata TaxID=89887 RepID=UPI002D2184A2|nr:cytochrome b5 reductase 4 [Drosophila sulfurigaster albostrigata]
MSDATLETATQNDEKPPSSSPIVATLSASSLQLPTTSQQKLCTPSSGSATGNPRNKCALKPGYSLMSWVRLCNSGADLTGTGGRIEPVTREELAQHNRVDDAWVAIRGRVFNVTHYMDFHPGGVDELMRGVGRDATKLFEEIHAWVNYPQLLNKCYIGQLKDNASGASILAPPSSPANVLPRFDWTQTFDDLSFRFQTYRWSNPGVFVQHSAAEEPTKKLEIAVQVEEIWHGFGFELCREVLWPPKAVLTNPETGKIEVVFAKYMSGPWTKYGNHVGTVLGTLSELLKYEVHSREDFNHDSFQLNLQSLKQEVVLRVPIGSHVDIELPHNGEVLQRSYTPLPYSYLPGPNREPMATKNDVKFLIKYYEKGAVSKELHEISPGTLVKMTVPRGSFKLSELEKHRNILLLAAGSGITPMLSFIKPLLLREANRIERVHLMYFNKTIADIWQKNELKLLLKYDERFTCVHYTSEAGEEEQLQVGRIGEELLAPLFKEKDGERFSYALICGPTGFNTAAVDALTALKMKTEQIHVFQG